MPHYTVRVSAAPEGHALPSLLRDVGAFVAEQEHGALGWFDAFVAEPIPEAWSEDHADRLRKSAFTFLSLPDGSLLALVSADPKAPAAVTLLGSEGDARTIADSLEEFLLLWSKGETTIGELDDEDASRGRPALAAWLKRHKIKKPKTKPFDFAAWLDGGGATEAPKTAPRAASPAMDALGPKLRALASILGQRGDAPEVLAYVGDVLKKKVPASTTATSDSQNVAAPRAGVELVFSHDVTNDAFPPIPKTAKSFVPYVTYAWVSEAFGEPVLGVPWKASLEDVKKILGQPDGERPRFTNEDEPTLPYWTRDLGGGVELDVSYGQRLAVALRVKQAMELDAHARVATGLFVAWAAIKGLLDETRFAAHTDLLAATKARKATGSELLRRALPRGLWTDHLKDAPGLRITAFRWFHNMAGLFIEKDMKAVFGETLPVADTWDAVDAAESAFASRFARWIKE